MRNTTATFFAMATLVLAAAGTAWAQPNTLTRQEIEEGWVLLFDGESLFGWQASGGAQWKTSGGSLMAEEGETGWLLNTTAFSDFILKCDFRTIEGGNSGIFLRSAKEGRPWQTGYELQIWDNNEKFPTGSLVNHATATKKARILGNTWHRYEVAVVGDQFTIKLDGDTVLQTRDPKSRAGLIGLQYNKDNKIEFRNLKIRPVGARKIFNDRDLSGWKQVNRPDRPPPEWSVKNGMLHVEKGPGQLETEATFRNFILQLDIRANSQDPNHHPNSGIFFRGTPNGYWTGYEAQIRNEFKDNDPAQPVDFGTGGIYFHQPARRVVSRDNRFFTMTVHANGRHLAAWVDGILVSDWEDPHPEGTSPRNKEAILGAGTISLQAHDPTTNLDFRNIRVLELP